MDLRWEILVPYAPLFLTGVRMTIQLTVIALVLGLVLGLGLGLVTAQPLRFASGWRRLLRWLCMGYVGFLRGTPLFVQILLVHFALVPTLIHPEYGWLLRGEMAGEFRQEYGAFFSGCIALTLNAAAYISEIVRAGILSITSIVVLPQALRRMVPPLVNEAVTLLKDSSLVSAIGLAELAMAARTVAGAYSRYWEPYLAISLMYLILTGLITWLAHKLETPAQHSGR
jgi:polar amino acid transport system permease protein